MCLDNDISEDNPVRVFDLFTTSSMSLRFCRIDIKMSGKEDAT
jgi:hypothetical protein